MTTDVADLVKRLRASAEKRHRAEWDMMSEADGGLTHRDRFEWMAADRLEAQSAIISEKNDLIDKLEAERETLITELERLLEQLGRKDLSI